jgi:hypothetical protein
MQFVGKDTAIAERITVYDAAEDRRD